MWRSYRQATRGGRSGGAALGRPAFQSVAWEEPGVLLLEDDAGGWWRYDLAGGTLLAVP